MTEFGELKNLPLRNIWPKEASDFTPWLAENINILGKALGIDLELQAKEAEVGDFSLDLLAKDVGSNRVVVIENQLASTDHDHLGKLLTYASGYDASVVVWLAEHIREEHRQALDWLNQRTDSETQFFGVVVEVIQIDDSKPAYNFKPVVFPNEWRKERGRSPASPISSKGKAYQEFFQLLIDELREKHGFTKARRGQPQNWYSFSSGTQGFYYDASFAQGDRVRAGVYIDNGDREENKRLFDFLEEDRAAIETELDYELEWDRLDDKRASRISAYRDGYILTKESDLEEIRAWIIQRLLAIKKVLGPRVSGNEIQS